MEESSDDEHQCSKLMEDEYFDRIDSKGKRIQIRRVDEEYELRYYEPSLSRYIHSFAKINIQGNTLPTQKELSLRAKTLAYGQYKKEKRLFAKH